MAAANNPKSQQNKTLEATIVGSLGGLVAGAAFGYFDAATCGLFEMNEVVITGAGLAVGSITPIANDSRWIDYLLGIGSANAFFRIGYYGSKAIYSALR